jgi:hypothetical protein
MLARAASPAGPDERLQRSRPAALLECEGALDLASLELVFVNSRKGSFDAATLGRVGIAN